MMLQGRDNIAAFLLHDLCHQEGFNFHRGAYFVDNPDFDCLKGVAGVHQDEHSKFTNGNNGSCIWLAPDEYSTFHNEAAFNKLVRAIDHKSIFRNKHKKEGELIRSVANLLGFAKPEFYSWPMKYDNKGILLFERVDADSKNFDEHMLNCVHLFSFCPVA
jgi:hypothetical protein